MWYSKLITSSKHTTAIIALYLKPSQINDLHINKSDFPTGTSFEHVNDFHVSLIYLGECALVRHKKKAIELVLKTFAHTHAPVIGKLGGLGCFEGTEEDGKPFYITFDSPGLPQMREELVTALENIGIARDEQHGFVPHISLAYLPHTTKEMPLLTIPDTELRIDHITLCWQDTRTDYKLETDL